MYRRLMPLALVLALAPCGAALADHPGVTNPIVQSRINLMSGIRKNTMVLVGMIRAETPFDGALAEAARAELEASAGKIRELFEAQESDPKSEALATIWSDWSGFSAAAIELQDAAATMDASTLDSVRNDFSDLGRTCVGCHQSYRASN